MTEKELNNIWNYFLALESDLDGTSRYIEPAGQENVFSFEFAKLLILACTEVESVFKAICFEIEKKQVSGNIGTYKHTVLSKYPKIVESCVHINRLGYDIKPFEGWDKGPLNWWDAYQLVKHSRRNYFKEATYINATKALSALYILIFYLSKTTKIDFPDSKSKYIESKYASPYLLCQPSKKLPDFE